MSEVVQVPQELKADLKQAGSYSWDVYCRTALLLMETHCLYQKVIGNKKKELKWGGEGEEGKKRLNNTMAKTKSTDRGAHGASAGTTKAVCSPLPSPAQ